MQMCMCGDWGRSRGGVRGRESQADSSLSVESSISHDPEITTRPEIKNGSSTQLIHPGAPMFPF